MPWFKFYFPFVFGYGYVMYDNRFATKNKIEPPHYYLKFTWALTSESNIKLSQIPWKSSAKYIFIIIMIQTIKLVVITNGAKKFKHKIVPSNYLH